MDLVFETSRTGDPSCKAGRIRLHSAYDPRKEALRFLEASLPQGPVNTAILLGPGLDYLSEALAQAHPGCRVLRLQYAADLEGHETVQGPPTWYPGQAEPLGAFLSRNLDEDGLAGIRILEWEASAMAWPEEAARAKAELKSALDILASSAATLKVYGPAWISNACRNFLLLERVLQPRPESSPIVVAAAGPSLESALAFLKARRKAFRLLAVSSSLASLEAAGLEPDLVVASDGGFWSRYHLYPLATRKACLASPLSSLPSACLASCLQVLPLVQEGFPELELAALLGAGLALPSHGTVSGTAIHLAAALGTGPIIVVGLDLAVLDCLAHARPHGFDALLSGSEGRLRPMEGILLNRERPSAPERLGEGPWRTSRSLALYARALSAEAQRPPLAGRLWRLNPSPLALEGFRDLDLAGLDALVGACSPPGPFLTLLSLPARPVREELLRDCLESWKARAEEAARGLVQGKKPDSPRDREMLKAIDLPDWAAACRALDEGRDASASAQALGLACEKFLNNLGRRLLSWTT